MWTPGGGWLDQDIPNGVKPEPERKSARIIVFDSSVFAPKRKVDSGFVRGKLIEKSAADWQNSANKHGLTWRTADDIWNQPVKEN